MQTILNEPVLSIQLQYSPGISLFSWYVRETIHHFYSLFTFFFHCSAYQKNLCNPSPFLLEPGVHLRTGPNFTHFSPSMPFIHLFVVLKLAPINSFILEKFCQILKHQRIILFYRNDVISIIGMDCCIPIPTTKYRVSTENTPFDQ